MPLPDDFPPIGLPSRIAWMPEPMQMPDMSHMIEAAAKRSASHESTIELAKIANASLASEFKKRLEAYITQFDEHLDQNHEVGLRLVSFGQTITFHVTEVGYFNPSL